MREKWHFRIFEMALIVLGIVIGVLGFMIVREMLPKYKSPVSVDSPALASLPRNQWPEHGLDAVERGIVWGQCGVCGFPVTILDIENGFGDIVWREGRLPWGEFSCYRHVNKVLGQSATFEVKLQKIDALLDEIEENSQKLINTLIDTGFFWADAELMKLSKEIDSLVKTFNDSTK